jgi:4a-hydroxytetrahydrobiopterin dehydratase
MPTKLDENDIQVRLGELDGWEVQDGMLVKTFTLPSFAHAVLMVGAVGQLAEAADHHPDLRLFGYKKLTVSLVTHSAGGLTENDFNLAKQIQSLPQRKPKS